MAQSQAPCPTPLRTYHRRQEAKTVLKARPMGQARTITTCSPDRQAIVDTVLANTVKLADAIQILLQDYRPRSPRESIRSSPRRSQRSWLYQRQHQLLLHRPVAREEQLQGELPRLCVGSVQHDCEL
ncbi:hypothetical protein SI65_10122 [Aspergillus cristatus]|uniref:Uncharacterized protein n=1 Tax=Aspergillus cristatus TaxID=573508 RepID=A0A1E3B0N1_ASPCR|nr:hypothetical protein SI65_10122 [Aspergillus cristatus]